MVRAPMAGPEVPLTGRMRSLLAERRGSSKIGLPCWITRQDDLSAAGQEGRSALYGE
jgi:hypothetical protein